MYFHVKTQPTQTEHNHGYSGTHTFSSSSLSLYMYETKSSSKASTLNNDAVSYHNMITVTAPFPTPTVAATFSGKSVSSPPRHVRFRSVASFAAATRTEEQRRRPASYLSPHGMASSCTTLYEILGIRSAASGEEIKAAYRRLARVCHPDVAPVDRKESSADEFMKIHAAYCTLSDPEKRAIYDRSLFPRQQRPLTTTSSRGSGSSGRNWETDQCW